MNRKRKLSGSCRCANLVKASIGGWLVRFQCKNCGKLHKAKQINAR